MPFGNPALGKVVLEVPIYKLPNKQVCFSCFLEVVFKYRYGLKIFFNVPQEIPFWASWR